MNRLRGRSCIAMIGTATLLAGCGWHGVNSLPLPGTEGNGAGSFTVQAQFPEVTNLLENGRVRVGDVVVGHVSKIERQGWHALVTLSLNGDVELPNNATATIGQTSLLGSLHVELAPPTDSPPEGNLHQGSVIPLTSGDSYPTTEQTLAVASTLLNGGGIGQLQDITKELASAFGNGRDVQLRDLLSNLDEFVGHLDAQKADIISATDSLNGLAAKIADQKPVVDRALDTIPNAVGLLREQRDNLVRALDAFGRLSALATAAVGQTKENLVKELEEIAPVLRSLADSGPALTRSLSLFTTYPFPNDTLQNFIRGDFTNLTAVIDLTLSRLDSAMFTGTRFEGKLTKLELQWGRTIGQTPSPYTAGNPLVAPYHLDQGP